jgi:hypothetical protein
MKRDYVDIVCQHKFEPDFNKEDGYKEHLERHMYNQIGGHIYHEKDTMPVDFSISEELLSHGRVNVARLKVTVIDRELLKELLVYRDYARNNGFVYKSRERERDDMLRKLGK